MAVADELARIAGPPPRAGSGVRCSASSRGAAPGRRVYLVAYGAEEGAGWLAVEEAKNRSPSRAPSGRRSIAALCEVAADAACRGDLDELRAQLVALRDTEMPEGIEEAEEARP